jgi:AAA family ATP:ADP antiporter
MRDWLASLIPVRSGELPALIWSFAVFFCVLCSYYILRPLRDEMGVALGRQRLEELFSIIFLVMLAAVPVFGLVVARLSRRWVLPAVYVFFIANLVVFWGLWSSGKPSPGMAAAFYVWVNVYVMFVVSVFWSFMSDVWASEPAKRLYGAIAVGGTAGALTGPVLIQVLLGRIGLAGLLLLAAAFLAVALAGAMRLRALLGHVGATETKGPLKLADVVAGATNVVKDPYLFKIALWVLIANVIGMFFYLEQARIVGETIKDQAERVLLFSRIETAVSIITILLQGVVAARLIKGIGVGAAAALLPAGATLGLLAFALAPTLATVVGIMIVQRSMGYGVANPAMRVLYTVVGSDDKYRAQNFIDTVVYRGGDAGAGWAFKVLGKSFGLGVSSIALLALPLAALWAVTSLKLGREQAEKAAGRGAP